MKNFRFSTAVGLFSILGLMACSPVKKPQSGVQKATIQKATTEQSRLALPFDLQKNSFPVGFKVDPESESQKRYEEGKQQLQAGNTQRAEALFLKSSEAENVSAYFALAKINHHRVKANADDDASRNKMLFYLRLAADRGHGKAQTMLGIMYEKGSFLATDLRLALQYYVAAAKGGIAQAQYNMANIFANPDTPYYALEQAILWWEKAADLGIVRAQSKLALLYFRGNGVRQDKAKAEQLWQAAWAKGDAQAAFGLAQVAEQATPPDYQKSFALYTKALQGGLQEAALPLARHYQHGHGTSVSLHRAFDLYKVASGLDDAEAYRKMGVMKMKGIGTSRDLNGAVKLLQTAYDLGDSESLKPLLELNLLLGKKPKSILQNYFRKTDTSSLANLEHLLQLSQKFQLDIQSYTTPEQWAQIQRYRAEKGDVDLQKQFAKQASLKGNVEAQKKWLIKASNNGDVDAKFSLAQFLRKQNDPAGLALLKRAALQGHLEAQYLMGELHAQGDEVPKDEGQAYFWFMKAAQGGHVPAAWQAYRLVQQQANIVVRKGDLDQKTLLRLASDGGVSQATLGLATEEADHERKKILLEKAYAQGKLSAGLHIAEAEYLSIDRDKKRLKHLYRQAADEGDERALFRLAEMSLFAVPIEENLSKDVSVHREASWKEMLSISKSAQDNRVRADALWQTGHMFLTGDRSFGLKANLLSAKNQFEALRKIEPLKGEIGLGLWAQAHKRPEEAISYWQNTQEYSLMPLFHLWKQEIENPSVNQRYGMQGLTQALEKMNPQERAPFRNMANDKRKAFLKRGDLWAIYDFARDAERGTTQSKNTQIALKAYHLSAELGLVESHVALGRYYRAKAKNNSELLKTAEAHFIRAIDLNSNEGMVALAEILINTPQRDTSIARNLLKQASTQGDVQGTLYYAYVLDQGIGGPKEPQKAFLTYKKLAEKNNTEASLNLARMYYQGKGTKLDQEKAVALYQFLAESGDHRAWLSLGKIFSNPRDKERFDVNKASGYFLLAANTGLAEAWYELGKIYDPENNTPLVPESFKNARLSYQYYHNAAELDWSDAQYQVGLGYRHGYGTLEKDPLLAYAWLELAARNGDVAASMLRDSIQVDLKEGDLDRIREIIKTLVP